MAQIRIDKYLADMGIGTRSEVKKIQMECFWQRFT